MKASGYDKAMIEAGFHKRNNRTYEYKYNFGKLVVYFRGKYILVEIPEEDEWERGLEMIDSTSVVKDRARELGESNPIILKKI